MAGYLLIVSLVALLGMWAWVWWLERGAGKGDR